MYWRFDTGLGFCNAAQTMRIGLGFTFLRVSIQIRRTFLRILSFFSKAGKKTADLSVYLCQIPIFDGNSINLEKRKQIILRIWGFCLITENFSPDSLFFLKNGENRQPCLRLRKTGEFGESKAAPARPENVKHFCLTGPRRQGILFECQVMELVTRKIQI